jgi:hypothetical protein
VAILVTPRQHPAVDEAAAPGQPATGGKPKAAVGLLARSYAAVVVSLRLLIIAGWAAAVAARRG